MDPKTIFIITVTTAKMIMPGMPAMQDIPGMKNFSAPMHILNMNLTSDKAANANSKAECAIPEGLKLGPKVDLTIDLPEKATQVPDESGGKEEKSEADFKLKTYWSCSETVIPGQPKIIDSKNMNKAIKEAMANKNYRSNLKQTFDSAENGSHAYWPGKDSKEIAKDARCPGNYALTTNYCGGTSIVFDKPQDFLAPIDLVSPAKKIDFEKFIKVEWKKVPNAVAYMIYAFSGNDKEMISWTSSSDPNPPIDLQNAALSAEKIEKYIKGGILLPADATFCCIPAGIFKTTKSVTINVIAFGVDKIQTKDGIVTHVIVRSNATAAFGDGMGMDEEEGNVIDEDSASDGDKPTAKEQSSENSEEPAANENDTSSNDSGDAADKANDKMDKADKVKDTLKRAKDILKW